MGGRVAVRWPLRRHGVGDGKRNAARTRAAYTAAKYQRLQEVKRIYDLKYIFHRNYNIEPAGTPGLRCHLPNSQPNPDGRSEPMVRAAKQPRTKAWSHKTVADVLANRVYLGEVHFARSSPSAVW
jgi:hypothetical protein